MIRKVLLLMIAVTFFSGCATDSDPDRLSWDDAKDQVASMLGKDTSSMAQAKADQQDQDDNAWASQNFLKK